MSDLGANAVDFLQSAGWAEADIRAIAGDMSTRRYFRLTSEQGSAILMVADAPMTPFMKVTNWLAKIDLTVPEIFANQAEDGLVLLEDFGSTSLKSALRRTPSLQAEAFEDCITLLLNTRDAKPCDLPCPDARELVEWTRLADDHYPGIQSQGLHHFRHVLNELLDDALSQPRCVSLRDFHTENMMWLPDRQRHLRLGLLDYQDAFLTHPSYDLMSLLTDARTWIPADIRTGVLDRYIERSGDSAEDFKAAFAAFSAQRNLRILGIFSRAGKHTEYMPNTYRYLIEALEHPAFDAVRSEVLNVLPPPKGTI